MCIKEHAVSSGSFFFVLSLSVVEILHFSIFWVVYMEKLIEEASNNNWFNFFVIFVNDEANCNFWPTYVEIWDIRQIWYGLYNHFNKQRLSVVYVQKCHDRNFSWLKQPGPKRLDRNVAYLVSSLLQSGDAWYACEQQTEKSHSHTTSAASHHVNVHFLALQHL